MCGIFFAINNSSNKNSKIADFLRDAFITSQVRGLDGSGMAIIGGKSAVEQKHPFFFKTMINGSGFIEQSEAKTGFSRAGDADVILCHVRAATHGKVSIGNSHPFRITRDDGSWIIGVHNGTLSNWERGPNADKYEVDSEWALRMIADEGIDAFEYFTGSFAFVWSDSREPDKVYMARNDRRPLNFLVDQSRKLMFGASEPGMLGWLAERNAIIPAKDSKGANEMYYLNPDILYTFDTKKVGTYTMQDLPKYDYKKLPTTTSTTTTTPTRSYAPNYDRASWDYEDQNYSPLGMYGSHWNNGSRGTRVYRRDQEFILDAMKEALKSVRDKDFAKKVSDLDSAVVDGEAIDRRLEQGIKKSIENFEQASITDEAATVSKPIFVHEPLSATANRGEINAARNYQVYGQIVSFVPTLYDGGNQVLIGEFTVTMRKEKLVVLGELRHDITTEKANALINDGKPILVSVIGMSDAPVRGGNDEDLDDYTYVVANRTEDQRSLVRGQIASQLH